MINYKEIEPQLFDRWPEFIRSVTGYEIPNLKGKGHQCPRCGGTDRAHFRIKNGRAVLFCRGACGTADSAYGTNTMTPPEHLIMDMAGLSFAELVSAAADFVGYMPAERNKPKPQKAAYVRPELAALNAAAVPIKPVTESSGRQVAVDSYFAARFAVKLESLFEIGGIESVPLFDANTLLVDAYLQLDNRGRQRVIGNKTHDRLFHLIGEKVADKMPIYCTSFSVGMVLHRYTGRQVYFSPAAKLWDDKKFDGVMLPYGTYESFERASLAFCDTAFYYPANPSCFEFDGKILKITLDKINDFLNMVECA